MFTPLFTAITIWISVVWFAPVQPPPEQQPQDRRSSSLGGLPISVDGEIVSTIPLDDVRPNYQDGVVREVVFV